MRFHDLLAHATGDSYLCELLEKIQNQIWLSRCKAYDLSSSIAPDFHDAIVKVRGNLGAMHSDR